MGRKSPWSPANGNCMSTRGATDNFGGNRTRGTVVTGTHLPKHRWNCHVYLESSLGECCMNWKIWKCVRLSQFNMATPPTKSMPCETSILRRQTWLQCCHFGPGHSAHCFSHVGAPGRFKGRIRVRIENLLGGSSSLDH